MITFTLQQAEAVQSELDSLWASNRNSHLPVQLSV